MKTNVLLKIVSVITLAAFLQTQVAYAVPALQPAEQSAAGSALAAKGLNDQLTPEEFAAVAELQQNLNAIVAGVMDSILPAAAQKDKTDAEIIAAIENDFKAKEAELKAEGVLTDQIEVALTGEKGQDRTLYYVAIPIRTKAGKYLTYLVKNKNAPAADKETEDFLAKLPVVPNMPVTAPIGADFTCEIRSIPVESAKLDEAVKQQEKAIQEIAKTDPQVAQAVDGVKKGRVTFFSAVIAKLMLLLMLASVMTGCKILPTPTGPEISAVPIDAPLVPFVPPVTPKTPVTVPVGQTGWTQCGVITGENPNSYALLEGLRKNDGVKDWAGYPYRFIRSFMSKGGIAVLSATPDAIKNGDARRLCIYDMKAGRYKFVTTTLNPKETEDLFPVAFSDDGKKVFLAIEGEPSNGYVLLSIEDLDNPVETASGRFVSEQDRFDTASGTVASQAAGWLAAEPITLPDGQVTGELIAKAIGRQGVSPNVAVRNGEAVFAIRDEAGRDILGLYQLKKGLFKTFVVNQTGAEAGGLTPKAFSNDGGTVFITVNNDPSLGYYLLSVTDLNNPSIIDKKAAFETGDGIDYRKEYVFNPAIGTVTADKAGWFPANVVAKPDGQVVPSDIVIRRAGKEYTVRSVMAKNGIAVFTTWESKTNLSMAGIYDLRSGRYKIFDVSGWTVMFKVMGMTDDASRVLLQLGGDPAELYEVWDIKYADNIVRTAYEPARLPEGGAYEFNPVTGGIMPWVPAKAIALPDDQVDSRTIIDGLGKDLLSENVQVIVKNGIAIYSIFYGKFWREMGIYDLRKGRAAVFYTSSYPNGLAPTAFSDDGKTVFVLRGGYPGGFQLWDISNVAFPRMKQSVSASLEPGYSFSFDPASGLVSYDATKLHLEIAGVPAAIPEVAKVPVAATEALKTKMDAVDVEVQTLMNNIETFVNIDALIKDAPGFKGLTAVEVKAKLVKELSSLIDGTTLAGKEKKHLLETKYYKGFTVGSRLLAHADLDGGAIDFAEDMLMQADPALVARVKVHELLHHVLGDAEHKYISQEEALRDQLLSENLMKSTAAAEVEKALMGPARDLSLFQSQPANAKSPSVIYVTADPDNMNLLHAAIEKRKDNKNLKIIIVYNDNYKWTADYREKLMKQYPGIVVGFVSKSELAKKSADADEALVLAAQEATRNDKLTAQDIGFIGSDEGVYEGAYQVAKGLKKIPEIRPSRKSDDEFHDVGALIDIADLAVMAHRILGDKYDPAMTFAQMAATLGGDLGKQFLAQIEALGMNAQGNVAESLAQIPPTTKGVTGELQNSINSLRSTLTAA